MMAFVCPDDDHSKIAVKVLGCLQAMDQEALPVWGDYPTRLWWYSKHLDRNSEQRLKNNTEVCWTRRLSELMGVDPKEKTYPWSRQRCDVVVPRGERKPIWIEVKGAWRAYFDPPRANSSYFEHINRAANDVAKLESLTKDHASAIIMVLIGFDQELKPIEESDLLPIRKRIGDARWTELNAQWHVTGRVEFRERLWLWSREVI